MKSQPPKRDRPEPTTYEMGELVMEYDCARNAYYHYCTEAKEHQGPLRHILLAKMAITEQRMRDVGLVPDEANRFGGPMVVRYRKGAAHLDPPLGVVWRLLILGRATVFPRLPKLPRALDLLGYLLPQTIREQVFGPCKEELLEDYVVARRRYRSRWARRWLAFCFLLRTAVIVAESLRAWGFGKALDLLSKLVPASLRHWWFGD